MKDALRLAQSLHQQTIEEIGLFECLSRCAKARFGGLKKRDSRAHFQAPKIRIKIRIPGSNLVREWHAVADLLEKARLRFLAPTDGQCCLCLQIDTGRTLTACGPSRCCWWCCFTPSRKRCGAVLSVSISSS